ncbi:tRNA1(Val) (adenine(37)-N6)-methyltransferase [Aestuariivirga sp.]|uniref:tRNA1(Val) (adenine(37)-N6)-methyltransferase n=1 Tax=Aestuariivirga sp. TaxID=2650926 RepID=UPI00391A3653
MNAQAGSDPSGAPQSPGGVPSSLSEDAFLNGRLRILQPEKGFRAGIDSVFLAAAVPCGAGEAVYEAGIGTGVAALCLLARNPTVHVTGIEVASRYALLCEENAKRNGFADSVRVIRADVRDALRRDLSSMPVPGSFSHAFANPPFFEEGRSTPSPHALKAQAHAFGADDLDLWMKVLHSMVVLRGTVTLVHRADALGKVLSVMDERFGDIRIAPLHAREGTAASRVVVQGVKGSRAPMQLLPGLVLHDADSRFTPEADQILREGMAWRLR